LNHRHTRVFTRMNTALPAPRSCFLLGWGSIGRLEMPRQLDTLDSAPYHFAEPH
jgi:hypothetical protein